MGLSIWCNSILFHLMFWCSVQEALEKQHQIDRLRLEFAKKAAVSPGKS